MSDIATKFLPYWRPSDPSGSCVKYIGSDAGELYADKPYEDFFCLYPWTKSFYMNWELNWRPYWLHYFMRDHPEIPVLACVLYGGALLFGVRYFRNKPAWNLRSLMAAWNLSLSVFSLMGVIRMAPVNYHILTKYTFAENLCFDPVSHAGHGPAGVWAFFFSISKFAELFDTFFIVVHKKPLMLLHWYHHMTVLVYVWFYLVYTSPAGMFFSLINYSVHTVMYFYYCCMALRYKPKWLKPKLITVAQLTQMVVGVLITVGGIAAYLQNPDTCRTNPSNIYPGMYLYASYFVLFLKFFLDRYFFQKTKHSRNKTTTTDAADKNNHNNNKNKTE